MRLMFLLLILSLVCCPLYAQNNATKEKTSAPKKEVPRAKPANLPKPAKPFSLVSVLPARTLAVLGCPDVAKSRKAMPQTNAFRFWKDPEIKRFVSTYVPMLRSKVGIKAFQLKNILGVSLEQLLELPHQGAMVALVDVNLSNPNAPADVVISLSVNSVDLIQKLIAKSNLPFTKENFQGIPVYTTMLPVCYAVIAGNIVAATKKSLLQELIVTYQKDTPKKRLYNSRGLEVAVKNFLRPNDTVLFGVYLNLANAFEKFGAMLPPTLPLGPLGVNNIRSVSMVVNANGKKLNSRIFAHVPDPKRGLHELYANNKVDVLAAASNVPSNACLFYTASFDLKDFFGTVERLLRAIDPSGGLLTNYSRGLFFLDKTTGISLKGDLAEGFGATHTNAFVYPKKGGLFPQWLHIVDLKEQQKAQRFLQAVLRIIGFEVKSLSYRNKTIYYAMTPVGPPGNVFRELEKLGRSFRPEAIKSYLGLTFSGCAYMYDNSKLYIAESTHGLMNYIDWKISGKPALSGVQKFTSLERKDSCTFVYIDQKRGIQRWWNSASVLLRSFEGVIRKSGVPFESALLPRAQTLAKYLGDGALQIASNKDGLVISANGMANIITIGGGLGILAATAMLPQAVKKAREKAQREACKVHLTKIRHAMQLYRLRKFKSPQNIAELVATKTLDQSTMFCPNRSSKGNTKGDYCYLYHRKIKKMNPSTAIVAYCMHHKRNILVLYADGHMEEVSPWRFRSHYEDQAKALAKLGIRSEYTKGILPPLPISYEKVDKISFTKANGLFYRNNNPQHPYNNDKGEMVLTPDNVTSAAGVAFLNKKISFPFAIEFEYSIWDDDGGSIWNSADGLAVVFGKDIKQYDKAKPPVGGKRGLLSQGGGYGVHFRTYGYDRGIILSDGEGKKLQSTHEDSVYTHGKWRKVKVEVDSGAIKVYYNNTLRFTHQGKIAFDNNPYIGFAAATGGADSEHKIRNVVISHGLKVKKDKKAVKEEQEWEEWDK